MCHRWHTPRVRCRLERRNVPVMEKTGCCITNDSGPGVLGWAGGCRHLCPGSTVIVTIVAPHSAFLQTVLSLVTAVYPFWYWPTSYYSTAPGQAQIKLLMKYLWIEEAAVARQSRSADAGWAGLGWAGLVSAAIPLAGTVIIQRAR